MHSKHCACNLDVHHCSNNCRTIILRSMAAAAGACYLPVFRNTNAANSALACARDRSELLGNLGWKCLIGFWASACKSVISALRKVKKRLPYRSARSRRSPEQKYLWIMFIFWTRGVHLIKAVIQLWVPPVSDGFQTMLCSHSNERGVEHKILIGPLCSSNACTNQRNPQLVRLTHTIMGPSTHSELNHAKTLEHQNCSCTPCVTVSPIAQVYAQPKGAAWPFQSACSLSMGALY